MLPESFHQQFFNQFKIIIMKKHALLILTITNLLLISCKKETSENKSLNVEETATVSKNDPEEQINIFKGPLVNVGNGKIRSWIKIDHEEQPVEIGVEFTPGALEELPDHEEGEAHPHWDIPFHLKVKDVTPFDHLNVNWNPEGHPPVFFGTQHFDIHFYMTSESERMAIPEWSPSTDVLFNTYPPAGYMPANYSTPPGAVGAEAAMGKHWLPPPPSFLPFSHVMILGSYNGHFNFIEPMVTLNYLQSGQSVSRDYSQPQKFEKEGNYPTKYNVWKDESTGHHFVSLSHFVWRNAN